jgi:hypothetical protein
MSARMKTARMQRALGVLVLLLAAVGTSACASGSTGTDDGNGTVVDDGSNGTDASDGTDVDDGDADPAQDTKRSGPAVDFGGPPFGAQETLDEGDGGWCVKVGFFWGGAANPENVTFTIDGIISDPDGAVTADDSVCGQFDGVTASCIGMQMPADATDTVLCALHLRQAQDFPGSAVVTFSGTLECTEASFCDAAIARDDGTQDNPPPIIRIPA